MAPSQVSREKRPFSARASPSARDCRILNGESVAGCRCYPGSRKYGFQFSRPDYRVDFGNILTNIVAETLHQAARDHQLLGASLGLMLGHLQDGVDRLLLGAGNKRTGVDHDNVGVLGPRNQFGPGPLQHAHHDFAVHQILGTPQAYEPHLRRTRGRGRRFGGVLRTVTDKVFVGMQSIDFNTLAGIVHRGLAQPDVRFPNRARAPHIVLLETSKPLGAC